MHALNRATKKVTIQYGINQWYQTIAKVGGSGTNNSKRQTLMSLRSTLVSVSGSMIPRTASTAIGLIVSQFWLTTLDERQVSTALISVSLGRIGRNEEEMV